MERYTRYCRDAFLEIRENEWREVLLALVSYFLSLISPHVSNRYGIREVFNVTTGLFILAGMFNPRNLMLVLGGPLVSLVLLRVLRSHILQNKQWNLKKQSTDANSANSSSDKCDSDKCSTCCCVGDNNCNNDNCNCNNNCSNNDNNCNCNCNNNCNNDNCNNITNTTNYNTNPKPTHTNPKSTHINPKSTHTNPEPTQTNHDDVYTEETRQTQRIQVADPETKEELQSTSPMNVHSSSERAEMLGNRKQLGRAAVWIGLFYIIFAYCLFDAGDNCPFPAILVMLVKCFYISTATPSGKSGLFQYASYLLFLPGIRYGPAMTYSEYLEWLEQGYSYALKKLGAKERQALESEKDAKARGELEEFFIFAQYYRMFGLSMIKFFLGISYIVAYNTFIRRLSDYARTVRFIFAVPMVEILATTEKYRVIAQWAVEESAYLATFIPNMENVDIKGIEMSTELGGVCSAWNLKGIQHAHAVMDAFGGLRNGSEHMQLEYIWISLISYGHVFLFGKSPFGMALGIVSALIMPLVPDMVFLSPGKQRSAKSAAVEGLCKWMHSRFFFSYFLIGSLCDAQLVTGLWRKTLGLGHLVPLIAQNIIPLGKR